MPYRTILLTFLILIFSACAPSPAAIHVDSPSVSSSEARQIAPDTTAPAAPSITKTTPATPLASAARTSTEIPAGTTAEVGYPVEDSALLPATVTAPAGYPAEVTPVAVPDATATAVTVLEPVWSYRIINAFPHDRSAFTQGLIMGDDPSTLLEGTGRNGVSTLRRVVLESGEVLQSVPLDDQFFGEGITRLDGKIYQLTWLAGMGFVYDAASFELREEFTYDHEGWGITHNGRELIVSDGSSTIRFWDPDTLEETRRIQVVSSSGPVSQLNELEYVNGEIWANVWRTDLIARISPDDGRVLGWLDLTGLLSEQDRDGGEDVLNGIAYDQENGRLFVTGKLWPLLFEIEPVTTSDE